MNTKPLNGIGPGGKSPVDYLKERQLKELKRIAKAARKLENMREDCHCNMPAEVYVPMIDYEGMASPDGGISYNVFTDKAACENELDRLGGDYVAIARIIK